MLNRGCLDSFRVKNGAWQWHESDIALWKRRTAWAEKWCTCTVPPWVQTKISLGYQLQFSMKPPSFNGIVLSVGIWDLAHVLEDKIASLLSKRAIRVIPNEKAHQGIYSRYFLIPKKYSTSFRPILDLHVLNGHLCRYTFKMLTHNTLCHSIHLTDWFVTMWRMLIFTYCSHLSTTQEISIACLSGHTAYEFQTIPLGLLLAPQVFSKCVEVSRPLVSLKGSLIVVGSPS